MGSMQETFALSYSNKIRRTCKLDPHGTHTAPMFHVNHFFHPLIKLWGKEHFEPKTQVSGQSCSHEKADNSSFLSCRQLYQ